MNKKGFTLIELLVVIAVIAVILTLAFVSISSMRKKVNDAKRLADLRSIQSGLEIFYSNKNSYPVVPSGVTLGTGSAVCLNANGFAPAGCSDAFVKVIPSDPGTGSYLYTSRDGSTYTITTIFEAAAGTLQPGTVEASAQGIKNK